MKKILSISLVNTLLFSQLFAQNWRLNYAIKAAEKDAENFVLNDVDLKKFKSDRSSYRPAPALANFRPSLKPTFLLNPDFRKQRDTIDFHADWFKPTKSTTPDTLLLKDSVYTQHYRAIAYHKTVSRAKAVTTLGVIGIVAGGVVVIVGITAVLVAVLSNAKI